GPLLRHRDMRKILVTGGTGFIGSHIVVALQQAGYDVLVLDNLCNSDFGVVAAVGQITGYVPTFIKGDIRDSALLARIFRDHHIEVVMHLAGLKAVGESTESPLIYYDTNVRGTVSLLQAMQQAQVRTFVFSSSAT